MELVIEGVVVIADDDLVGMKRDNVFQAVDALIVSLASPLPPLLLLLFFINEQDESRSRFGKSEW